MKRLTGMREKSWICACSDATVSVAGWCATKEFCGAVRPRPAAARTVRQLRTIRL